MLLLLLTLGCQKPVDLGPPEVGTPIVPAPEGEIYTTSVAPPRDPLVAWVVSPPAQSRKEVPPDPLPYDEVLSGAAAAVGMAWFDAGRKLDLATVRWRGYLAGWPYPIEGYSLEPVVEGAPPDKLFDPAEGYSPEQRVGLARVRGPGGEVWVILRSRVPVPLSAFARDQRIGATLNLPALAPESSSWSDLQQITLSPSLKTHVGAVALDEEGEWLVELHGSSPEGQRKLLLRAPVYVAVGTPADGPFLGVSTAPADPAEAVRQTLASVDELRGLVDAPSVTTEPMLAAVARKEAERLAGGGERATGTEARLRAAGFPEGPVGELTCIASTVADCLDALFWSVDNRKVLLDPAYDAVGVGAAQVSGRTRVVVDLAQR
ncbi:MAG: CAP domain-containing protein [Alphaproteobacteria bacterium]|nr:CAP domain-containing protein [Alphaproteobacteria bacterium]